MALGKIYSISNFLTKFLWILCLVFQESNLVICDGLEDDSLKKALEAIERRQRDLEFQENDYYGQPENIGYGFQKTLGFFDSTGPATELGSFDSSLKNDNDLQNFFLNYEGYDKDNADDDNDLDKRKSNFRERMASPRKNYLNNQRDNGEDLTQNGLEYLQLLKNLWSKYRQTHLEDINIEDLTDEQVAEILNYLYEKEGLEERFGNDYIEPNNYEPLEVIPMRSRKNYRIFDRFGDKKKRYSTFGEGMNGERSHHSQSINYGSPSENEFLYSLKYVNPEFNREAVGNLRREGFETFEDEKDTDVIRILNKAINRPKYVEEDEPNWLKDQNNYEEEGSWLPGPVTFSDDGYDGLGRNEKRAEQFTPRYFQNHNGVHLNAKRFPVKRSSIRVRKEVKNDKVPKELKSIFAPPEVTTLAPKKLKTKKPIGIVKKQNATKPEITKHHEGKKVVRRADKYTKKEVIPMSRNEEIVDIFSVDKKSKKSIDWSQYFGLDKRPDDNWLKTDYLRRAEGHLIGPKNKDYSIDRGNVNFLDRSQYEMPFDTRKFNKKRYSYDLGTNIDKVENKIGDIEDKIIDDAVKYTGAHSGEGKEDLSQVKNKVIQRLEAAYSLEKMKNALEEFKSFIKPGKMSEPLKKIVTEAPKTEMKTTVSKESSNLEKPLSKKKLSEGENRRVDSKKEDVKSIFMSEPSDNMEFSNDVYGSKVDEDCPVLDKILHNCLRVEEMGGRYAELLVPLCSLQQICYFCGAEIGFSKMSTCDALFLTEAQNICQGNSDCLVNARNSMLALQDLYEQDLMYENGRRLFSGSCLTNSCMQRYFLSAPGAIYPLEIQK